jgi:hypothetical protein
VTTGLGQRMIKTVWLATICLAVLSALAVAKTLKTSADAIVAERPTDQMTVSMGLAQDPLSKADRLEITNVRQETLPHPAVQPTGPFVPAVSSTTLPTETKIISRHWHDPNAINSSVAKSKRTAKKGKSAADSSDSQAADRSKPNEPTKRCDRTAAFGGLLRSLNLAPACDS